MAAGSIDREVFNGRPTLKSKIRPQFSQQRNIKKKKNISFNSDKPLQRRKEIRLIKQQQPAEEKT